MLAFLLQSFLSQSWAISALAIDCRCRERSYDRPMIAIIVILVGRSGCRARTTRDRGGSPTE